MYRMICCALFLFSASSASAALVNTLKGPGNVSTVNVPLAGGTYDISVNLTRSPSDPTISSWQFDVIADTPGFATLNGVILPGPFVGPKRAGNTTTGTRYNDPEWDHIIFPNGSARDPDGAAGMLSPTPRGLIGTSYIANSGIWSSTSSLFGYLNITMGPGTLGQTVLISPVNNLAGGAEIFEDVPGSGVGVTFQYVPEPASALLMGIGLVVALGRKRTIAG